MKLLKNNKGVAFSFALLFLFLIIPMLSVFFVAASNGLTLAKRSADVKRAYYVADAGLNDAFLQLSDYSNPPATFNVSNSTYAVGGGKTGRYSVNVAGGGGSLKYTLTSTGTYNGLTKTLELQVQQQALSAYAYLSNTEIHPQWGPLWWISGMTTVGPVRTNGALNIWGDPVFDGPVTQSGAAVNYWYGPKPGNTLDNPNFVNGISTSSPSVLWPTTTLKNSISSAASSGGLALTGNTTIIFNSDGSMNVTNAANGWNSRMMAIPANGAIYVSGGSATVQGTIKGQATVGSDQEIYISGSLSYNTDPRVNPSSTDVLALVAQNNVTVTAQTAPTNIELDAVLVAINGSFQVDQWWAAGKGYMIQYGSLINNYCGPTGVFDPGTGTLYGGYYQLQYYDNRLKTLIPPAFPPAIDSNGRVTYAKLGFKEL